MDWKFIRLSRRLMYIAVYIACFSSVSFAETPRGQRFTVISSENLELCYETNPIGVSQAVDKALHSLINPCEIATSSLNDLRLIRNTIFAKYGREFKDQYLRNYFQARSWYKIRRDYTDELLNPDQTRNANVIQQLEELKKADNVSENQNIAKIINDQKVPDQFALLALLTKEKTNAIYHDLFHYEPGDSRYWCDEPMAVFIADRKEILFIRPCHDKNDSFCSSDIYSQGKELKAHIPINCPKYYFKQNPNLLLDLDFSFYNLAENRLVNPSVGCLPDFCRSEYFTWIPEIQKFVIATLMTEYQFGNYSKSELYISIVDKEGSEVGSGKVNTRYLWPDKKYPSQEEESRLVAEKITGIKEISKSQWLIKFKTSKGSEYVILTAGKISNHL